MSYHGFGLITRNISAIDTVQPTVQSRAPAAPETPQLPSNYAAEAMSCVGKTAVPIQPGKPGYPGFLCIDFSSLFQTATTPVKIVQAFTGGTAGTNGGRVDLNLPVKQSASGMSPAVQASTQSSGVPQVDTQQPAGTMTMEAFTSACNQVGGNMGTPNCCVMPDGTKLGLDGGKLVEVIHCDVAQKKSGLASNLPLIAGAAVVAMLLARGM